MYPYTSIITHWSSIRSSSPATRFSGAFLLFFSLQRFTNATRTCISVIKSVPTPMVPIPAPATLVTCSLATGSAAQVRKYTVAILK